MKRRDRFKKVLPLVLVVAVGAGTVFVAANLGHWLASPDRVGDVDVLVVPAGEVDRRLPAAVGLLDRTGASTVLVVPSGDGPVLGEVDAIEGYALEQGRADDVTVLARRSRDLVRDARIVADVVTDDTAIGVVTTPPAMARTRLVFERELGRPVQVWSDGTAYDADSWWTGDRLDTVAEAARYVSTLAVLGPGPELRAGSVPTALPLRAVMGGFAIALLVGFGCRPLARRLGLMAIPRLWRAHTTPTPMLGGLALLAGLAGGIVIAGGVRMGGLGVAAGVSVLVIALVGLVDDIIGLGAPVRLLWAASAGAIAWLLGLRAEVFASGDPAGDVINALVTVLWFVGITYAVGILDNIDGATAGVGAASAGTIAAVAALGGQFVVAVAAAALAGACLGYLVHNVHPARLFMGDMGSLGLGFALAALALGLTPLARPPLSMSVAIIALGVPIFDTVLVTISRMRTGRSPAEGGTDHTTHRLIASGMTVRQAAAFIWAAQVILGGFAVLVSRSPGLFGWVTFGIVSLGGLVALWVFLRMQPWAPPWQLEASERVVAAVERAMRSLRHLEEAVGDEAWRLSDPRAAKSTQETLRRLERVRGLLEERQDPGTEAGLRQRT